MLASLNPSVFSKWPTDSLVPGRASLRPRGPKWLRERLRGEDLALGTKQPHQRPCHFGGGEKNVAQKEEGRKGGRREGREGGGKGGRKLSRSIFWALKFIIGHDTNAKVQQARLEWSRIFGKTPSVGRLLGWEVEQVQRVSRHHGEQPWLPGRLEKGSCSDVLLWGCSTVNGFLC